MFTTFRNLNHGECVYNLIPKPALSPPKPCLYVSRYYNYVRKEAQCAKKGCNKTLGPPYVPLCPPQNYLRKHSRAPISIRPPAVPHVQLMPVEVQTGNQGNVDIEVVDKLPEEITDPSGEKEEQAERPCPAPVIDQTIPVTIQKRTNRICCNIGKPQIPPEHCTRFDIIPRGSRDFVRENAIKNIRQPAKIPEARYVDAPQGTSHEWANSGYAKKFVCRSDFGKVPGYLVQRRCEIQERLNQEKCVREQQKREAQEKCRHMTEDERAALIAGLKSHWERVYQEYQSLPLLVDTQMRIMQKVALEECLNGIEKDIQLFERHNHIFVADAGKSFYMA